MKTKKIDTSTLKGLKSAERLQARGWKPVAISFSNVVTLIKENE